MVQRKGGVAKTTLTIMLGLQLVEDGYSVGVLDLDTLDGSVDFVDELNDPRLTTYEVGDTPDYLIVDTPGNFEADGGSIKPYLGSGLLLVLTSLDRLQIKGVIGTAEILDKLGYKDRAYGIMTLINPGSRDDRDAEAQMQSLKRITGLSFSPDILHQRECYKSIVVPNRVAARKRRMGILTPAAQAEWSRVYESILARADNLPSRAGRSKKR